MKSCIYTPKKKGTNIASPLFKELLYITDNNRDLAIPLWALSQDSALLKVLNLDPNTEPSATQLLKALSSVDSLLDNKSYLRYINHAENTENIEFDNFSQALNNAIIINSRYNNITSEIGVKDNKFFVKAVNSDVVTNKKFAEYIALNSLNNKLKNYMKQLGFAVEEVANLESPGMFSPLNATTNAEELKNVIKISKDIEGQKALSEEFSHLLLEGYSKHPIFKRLIQQMTPEMVELVLGDQFEQYNKQYNSNTLLLQKEAAAKILGQYIINREGLNDSVRYISERAFDIIKNTFSKGDIKTVDGFVSSLDTEIQNFLDQMNSDIVSIPLFSQKAVLKSPTLYNLNKKVTTLLDIVKESEEVSAKRGKLLSLKNKEGKLDKKTAIAWSKIQNAIKTKQYEKGCLESVNYFLNDCNIVKDRLFNLQKSIEGKSLSASSLKRSVSILLDIETIIDGYRPILKTLGTLKYRDDLIEETNKETIEKISEVALEAEDVLNHLESLHKDLRFGTLYNFYSTFWKNDIKVHRGKEEITVTLEDVLNSNFGDTSAFARMVCSMQDLSDPLLQLMDIAYKHVATLRDQKTTELSRKIALIQKKYTEATGSRDVSFMYARDDQGKLTGMLISDRDFVKFYKDKADYLAYLKQTETDETIISVKLKNWVFKNTELVTWSKYSKERLPKKELYPSNALDNLNQAQRDYYDNMIALKKEIEVYIPNKNTHLYRAVQKRATTFDNVTRGNVKGVVNNLKSSFVTTVDDTEYGEEYLDKGKWVIRDFAGNQVQKVPIFYTTFLEDPTLIDTNFSEALLIYGQTAYNYHVMHNLADIMELTHSLAQDRKIIKHEGGKKLFERFRFKDKAFQKDFAIEGRDSKMIERVRSYIDTNLYNKKKLPSNVTVGNKKLNTGKIGDMLLQYGSLVTIGFNLFSGLTNIVAGAFQNFVESVGKEHFSFKSFIKANILFFKNINALISDAFVMDTKNNKMLLYLEKMDALENFQSYVHDSGFNKGIIKKTLNKFSPYFLQSLGELYLRAIPALALGIENQVTIDNKVTSVYDAFSIEEKEYTMETGDVGKYKELQLPKNALMADGTTFDEDTFTQFKNISQYVTHGAQGAYNEVDRGDLNRYFLGRAVIQYRQWMPAMFTRRYGETRTNVLLSKEEEKTYRTMLKFVTNSVIDLMHLKFNFITNFNNLSKHQKANMRKGMVEMGVYAVASILLGMKGFDDDEDPGVKNLIKLIAMRAKTELGGLTPTFGGIADMWNIVTESPVPAFKYSEHLLNLLDFTALNDEIESGKYAGWNEYIRNLYKAIPGVKQIDKVMEVLEGDMSAFSYYKR